MATTLSYSVSDFQAFTLIVSADVNTRFRDIKSRLNWAGGSDATTGLSDDNIQSIAAAGGGLTRATKLKAGTASHVIINDGAGAMSSEAQLAISRGGMGTDFTGSLAANPGSAVIVNSGGSALTLGSPIQGSITESFAGMVSTLTAGAAIAANDACCVDSGYDAAGNPVYRVFKADSSLPNRRRSFLGFAQAAATVTAGIYTWTASANFVTSNSIAYSINGRSYVTAFTTDNATTLQAVATQMATDPDVSGAVSNGVHAITITGKGGLTLYVSGSVVTGGASQPTITFATSTTATGQNVLVQCFGPLAGFTSLTVTGQYYLGTGGTITTAPTDTSPIQVGQALSTTVLFISNNSLVFQFGTPALYVRSHGSSTNDSSGGVQDVEHWNYASWAAGTSSSAGARSGGGLGDHAYSGFLHQLDGKTTGGTATLQFQRYNKAAWATLANRGTVGTLNCANAFNGYLYATRGSTTTVDKWNGSSWGTMTAATAATNDNGIFTQGGLLHYVAGNASNTHVTINTSDVSANATASPTSALAAACITTPTAGLYISAATTNSYKWTGSWSGAISATYGPGGTDNFGASGGFNSANTLATINGGSTGSVAVATSAQYNDTAWAGATASSNARSAATAGVF